jgi:hypothetical protein
MRSGERDFEALDPRVFLLRREPSPKASFAEGVPTHCILWGDHPMFHRNPVSIIAASLVALSLAPAIADAQICTVTAAGAAYVIPAASHYDTTQTSNFTGAGNGDYLFEDGWWFRVAGDTQESFFPAPTTTNCAGAGGLIEWTDVSARGLFNASNSLTLTQRFTNSGRLILRMTITNLSASDPLMIALFHGADFDVNATAAGDSATLLHPNDLIHIADSTAGFVDYQAFDPPADAFLVRPFLAASDVFGVLSDALVTDFDNSGLPASNIDFTGAYQWNLAIPPSGTASVNILMAANDDTLFADGFDVSTIQ